ncbi:hypothetical protein CVIRNUC_000027 [Coccomyxa viridis]|uniref:Protein kinase domain-containing protein n=1 Tax=Coccomyxa viridis TaxID=1274662 RepID=A0AAV1HP36_9CHLO|nr:hypothetical protein CVIRNUC_000027 [Coccomyxa viridis]
MEGSSSRIRRSQSLKDFMQRLGFLSFLPSRRQQGTGLHEAVPYAVICRSIVKTASPEEPAVLQALAQAGAGNECLIVEITPGGTLQDLLSRQMQTGGGKLYSDLNVCRWTLQLASALSYLHGQEPRIAFRDLSPANVLLTSRNPRTADVKLINFGLAREIPSSCKLLLQKDGSSCSVPTVQGRHVDVWSGVDQCAYMEATPQTGSCMYVAPEVTRRESYDESCDIFALGCLLYDLWTRQLRFVALFEHAAHANVLGQYAARVASGYRPNIPSEMPEDIASVITACWAQQPSGRPSAAEVLVRLQAVLAVLEGQNRVRLIPFSRISLSRVSCSHTHDQAECSTGQTLEGPVARSLPTLSSWLSRTSLASGKQSSSPKL